MIAKTFTFVLAAALAVQAAPAPNWKRQAVTALISSGTAPSGCTINSSSLFGIGIHPATGVPRASQFGGGTVTQGTDAQPAATTGPVTQATDAQPAVPTTPVSQISDAQPQAPTPVSVISDGQPQVPTGKPVSVISDGQPQAPTGTPVSVISDGQPQAPVSTMTMHPISQIHDGQAQAYYSMPAITQIGDGQIQAPTATGVSQITDGQIQAPTATGASQITDGQPQAPTAAATQKTDGQPGATPAPNVQMVACKSNSTLELTIKNGVLFDGQNRQGYIASNYQFQFDAGAPQAGALITAGFSLCANGTLALGGSAIFWQCLSGSFYNLYDRDWAYQCEPVYLTALDLIDCPA